MKTFILLENDPLWNRIRHFSFDAPDVEFPFSKKLAKEENWPESFTKRAIEEYKKFVYLCCILTEGASPSETVDKVWHLHLTYTRNYWEEFCPDILQRKLHHHPSNGGKRETEKHRNWFRETLENYRNVFGELPPKEIWFRKKYRQVFQIPYEIHPYHRTFTIFADGDFLLGRRRYSLCRTIAHFYHICYY